MMVETLEERMAGSAERAVPTASQGYDYRPPPPPSRARPQDPWYVRWTLIGLTLAIVGVLVVVPVVHVLWLALENGVFVMGLTLVEAMPFLVETGVLLDLVVAIFVMGIIIQHISREFSSIDTTRLSSLKE